MSLVIAIDGPTASGKGTVAERLAKKLNLPYLNTGGLYRAVALTVIKNNIDYNNTEDVIKILPKVDFSDLNNPELYIENVGFVASYVAKIKEVRSFLLDFQRNFASKGGVLDGRDIGTIVCPNADYKFFITASIEERAKRRYNEMISKGENVSYEDILEKLKTRDKNDKERKNSPLMIATDAIEIDTTNMTKDEVFDKVLSFF